VLVEGRGSLIQGIDDDKTRTHGLCGEDDARKRLRQKDPSHTLPLYRGVEAESPQQYGRNVPRVAVPYRPWQLVSNNQVCDDAVVGDHPIVTAVPDKGPGESPSIDCQCVHVKPLIEAWYAARERRAIVVLPEAFRQVSHLPLVNHAMHLAVGSE